MKKIGYQLEDIDVGTPTSFLNAPNIKLLTVKEKWINGYLDQNVLSNGMFRALAIIIYLNYIQSDQDKGCILIDDIGEGLDYDRSSALLDLLVKKAKKLSIQLIMTTNDRFIMNSVPIVNWIIVSREKGVSKLYNYENSKEIFNKFEYTGLNNFDFFSSGFYKNK
jgi:AAA15 family ATPase/GTPase